MRRTRTLLSWLIFIAALIAMVIPLPGKDKSHLLSASEASDNTLVILTTVPPEVLTPIVNAFTGKHNIPIRIESITPDYLTPQTILAARADLILVHNIAALEPLLEANALDTLPPDLLWNVKPGFSDPGQHWIAYTGHLEVLVYNPALVDPTKINASQHFSTGNYTSDTAIVAAVLSGDLPMGIVSHDSVPVEPLANLGVYVFHQPHMTISALALAQSSDSKPLAQLFLSLTYLPTTQNLLVETTRQYAFLAFGVPAPGGFPELDTLALVDFATRHNSNAASPYNQVASTQ